MPSSSKHRKTKKRKVSSKSIEEKHLEELVFGISDGSDDEYSDYDVKEPRELDSSKKKVLKPAWLDADDDIKLSEAASSRSSKPISKNTSYREILKNKHHRINGTPNWAQLSDNNFVEDDSDDEILKHAAFHKSASTTLASGSLRFKQTKDLNHSSRQEGPIIKSIEFHPTSQAALVAGLSGTVTLFQVGGKHSKIQSFHLEDFPIRCCRFNSSGRRVIIGSNQYKYFYYYDLTEGEMVKVPGIIGLKDINFKKFYISPDGKVIVVGNHGYIYILSSESYELIDSLKVNGEINDVAISKDGKSMYTFGETGVVHVFDMNSRSCYHTFHDTGCLQGTCIDLSSSGQLLACGCSSGVVNIYQTSSLKGQDPLPAHSIMSLVTPASSVKFNPTSEILSIMSEYKEGALRMVHFPSATTYKNFPGSKGVARPQCGAFSPNGGYFAAGNNRGRALLYRLQHFTDF